MAIKPIGRAKIYTMAGTLTRTQTCARTRSAPRTRTRTWAWTWPSSQSRANRQLWLCKLIKYRHVCECIYTYVISVVYIYVCMCVLCASWHESTLSFPTKLSYACSTFSFFLFFIPFWFNIFFFLRILHLFGDPRQVLSAYNFGQPRHSTGSVWQQL